MLIWCWQARWGAMRSVQRVGEADQRGVVLVQPQTSRVGLHARMLRR